MDGTAYTCLRTDNSLEMHRIRRLNDREIRLMNACFALFCCSIREFYADLSEAANITLNEMCKVAANE